MSGRSTSPRASGLPWAPSAAARPGTVVGPLLPEVGRDLGAPGVPVIAVGSHDTASAVVGVPPGRAFAYISSGTWSLVGLELEAPVLTEAAGWPTSPTRAASTGHPVPQERHGPVGALRVPAAWADRDRGATCRRCWPRRRRPGPAHGRRHRRPAPARSGHARRHAGAPRGAGQEAGEPVPRHPVGITRCILDSLALAYRRHVRQRRRARRP